PSSPAASKPPSARYGLDDESDALSSALVEPARSDANVEGTRTAASRLSGPHAVKAELQKCGWSRRYEFTLGHVSASRAGRGSRTPAMKGYPSALTPERPFGSYMCVLRPAASHRLQWMCAPLPA